MLFRSVSNQEQYDKLSAVCDAGGAPGLEHIVVMDDGKFEMAKNFSTLLEQFPAMLAEDAGHDAAFDAMVAAAQPDDLATIIYTSGTTGEPKGVMLTHGNLASNISISTKPFGFTEKDKCISFLPLSHVTARHLDYALMLDGATLAYCPKFDSIRAAMEAVKPTIFVAVPRVYEKIRHGVEGKSHGLKKAILNWALRVGGQHRQETLEGRQREAPSVKWVVGSVVLLVVLSVFVSAGRVLPPQMRGYAFLILAIYFLVMALIAAQPLGWRLADMLVFHKIRAAFGGRVWLFVSGGAPLGMDTAGWFADVGIRILEGYGLTETSPVIALNRPQKQRIGTVGPVLDNVEVRFAADGELEVRGPSVFKGYWNKPQETAEAFTEDGWLRTGDIGNMDADGFLSITDRKKELLKTSGGKLIAPQPIENKLKAHALVGNAALVGDKHKFACVLISPNFAVLDGWARVHGVTASDRKALVQDAQVVARYQRIVDAVNGTLAPFETIKRMAVVAEEWSIEGDELTPSMKLKRRVVEQRYAAEIAAFYKDEATATK